MSELLQQTDYLAAQRKLSISAGGIGFDIILHLTLRLLALDEDGLVSPVDVCPLEGTEFRNAEPKIEINDDGNVGTVSCGFVAFRACADNVSYFIVVEDFFFAGSLPFRFQKGLVIQTLRLPRT